jgi:hypothetical protein
MSIFYREIKKDKTLRTKLNNIQRGVINQSEKKTKENLYKKLVQTLLQDKNFEHSFNIKYGNKQKQETAQTVLFQADHFSEYYIYIKHYLEDTVNRIRLYDKKIANTEFTVGSLIQEIETEHITLLDVINAYTSLTHFDELLEETCGKQFAIKPGTKGIESDGDKYAYSQEQDH